MFPVTYNSLLTDAGDSGLLLPMALVGVLGLWAFHSRRLAWLLLRSVLLAGGAILALKLLFLSCASHWQVGLTSPSGHACLSAVVYTSLGTVLATGRPRAVRIAVALGVAAFVAAIAVSRVSLGVHTVLEVSIGLSVGLASAAWFAWSYARSHPAPVDLRAFGLALAATVLLAYGLRLPAESILRHLARRLSERCEWVVPARGAWAAALQPSAISAPTSSATARAVWS